MTTMNGGVLCRIAESFQQSPLKSQSCATNGNMEMWMEKIYRSLRDDRQSNNNNNSAHSFGLLRDSQRSKSKTG